MNGWQALGFKTYQDFLLSDIWVEKRDYVIKLRGCCEECESTKNLNVHHLTYERVGNEKGKDLKVLCRDCHDKVHNKNE